MARPFHVVMTYGCSLQQPDAVYIWFGGDKLRYQRLSCGDFSLSLAKQGHELVLVTVIRQTGRLADRSEDNACSKHIGVETVMRLMSRVKVLRSGRCYGVVSLNLQRAG